MRSALRPLVFSLVLVLMPAANAAASTPGVPGAGDLTPAPQATVLSGPPRYGNHSSVTFTFKVPAGTAMTACAVDDGPFAACDTRFSTGYLLDGRHSFHLRTLDATGVTARLDTVFTIDTLAPGIGLVRTRARISAGTVAFNVSCPLSEPGGCTGTTRLGTVPTRSNRHFRELGSARWRASGGQTVVVQITLPSFAIALARAGGGLPVNVVVVAGDDAGNVTVIRRGGLILGPRAGSTHAHGSTKPRRMA